MIKEQVLLKKPLTFNSKIKVYPPSVSDVVENKFFPIYQNILTMSQEEIEDNFVEQNLPLTELLTPLEFLLNNAYNDEKLKVLTIKSFEFFIHQKISFLFSQKKILVGNVEEELIKAKRIDDLFFLDENNFFDFQNLVRQSLGMKVVDPYNAEENPHLKKMKAKMRYRDKIKAKQKDSLTLETSLLSICCMNMGINPLNIGELSYGAIEPLIHQYQAKEEYDIDVKSIMMGADSKKVNLKYWIHNIEDE